jgi:hypothetical protein
MLGNVSPNLFVTFSSRNLWFDCVWFRLGFQNGFCGFGKWDCEMSQDFHLFILVICYGKVPSFDFEVWLVKWSPKTRF